MTEASEIRVAACQILTFPEPARSAEKVLAWLERAAEDQIDVIAFPEACLCGYTCDEAYWKQADPAAFRVAEDQIVARARQLGIAVVLGTAHREQGCWYNSLLVVDKGGLVRGRYSKTHLAESWSTPGRALPVYDLAGMRSCFMVCHDVRYPELVRLPAIAGAQICWFCSCESGLLAEYKLSAYRCMPIARAAENDIYLVMANAPADRDNLDGASQSHGNSKVIDPDGNVVCEAGFFEETLVAATIDVRRAKRRWAQRAVEDKSVLQAWLREGMQHVDREGCAGL